jgi:hypothetical protein
LTEHHSLEIEMEAADILMRILLHYFLGTGKWKM